MPSSPMNLTRTGCALCGHYVNHTVHPSIVTGAKFCSERCFNNAIKPFLSKDHDRTLKDGPHIGYAENSLAVLDEIRRDGRPLTQRWERNNPIKALFTGNSHTLEYVKAPEWTEEWDTEQREKVYDKVRVAARELKESKAWEVKSAYWDFSQRWETKVAERERLEEEREMEKTERERRRELVKEQDEMKRDERRRETEREKIAKERKKLDDQEAKLREEEEKWRPRPFIP